MTNELEQTLIARRTGAVRRAIALAMTGGDDADMARAWASARFEKAATSAVGFADVGATTQPSALFAAVADRAVLFNLGTRRGAFRDRAVVSGGVAGAEVLEGQPMPVLKPTISNTGVDPRKFAAVTVATKEALDSSAGIDEVLFADLTTGAVEALDTALLSGSGSLVGGLTPVTGTTDLASDIKTLVAAFTGDLTAAHIVLHPDLAVAAAGTEIGRNVGANGGTIAGINALVSRHSPAGQVALIDGSRVLAAWDEAASVHASQHANVEMDTTPGGTASVSMFQHNLVAFRAIVSAGWVAGPGAVAVLTGATW